MEINKYSSSVNLYNKINSDYKTKSKAGSAASPKNVDKAEFSEASRSAAADMNAAKAAVGKNISADTPAEKLSSIKTAIDDGTYDIPPEKVAAAVFEG